jgi:hypothetical protein
MDQTENKLPLSEQLYWAERHAADVTMADHNRNWFKAEAKRMRAQGITPTTPIEAFGA